MLAIDAADRSRDEFRSASSWFILFAAASFACALSSFARRNPLYASSIRAEITPTPADMLEMTIAINAASEATRPDWRTVIFPARYAEPPMIPVTPASSSTARSIIIFGLSIIAVLSLIVLDPIL